ncbi:MAG: phosphonate C-P lyase system protein PhnH [Cohaesibacteraceae bacterium]
MCDAVYQGGFTNPPQEAAHAFRATMQVMARPGTIETIKGGQAPTPVSSAAATLLLTLCDPDTGLFLAPGHDSQAMRDWVNFHTNAPLVSAEEADFALGSWQALQPLSAYKVGVPAYPDRAATLIVEMGSLTASGSKLSGPGIKESGALNLPEVAAFQANRTLFPLGFDCFFTAGDQIAALPRSTRVEEAA